MTDNIIKRLREATDGMYYAESKAELDGHLSNIIKALGLDHDSAGMTALLDRLDAAERENERLRSAINWACGYNEGPPHFGEQPERDAPYAWRHELRRRAGMPWRVERVSAIDAARAAEKGEGMNWIKTSDRLPDRYVAVLVYCDEEISVDSIGGTDLEPVWVMRTLSGKASKPSHWQPLPGPPSDERREG